MSVKKLLVLGAAAFAVAGATAAMAGGPDHMAMPSEPAFQNSVYIEGHFGYDQSNWGSFNANGVIGTAGNSLYNVTSNGKGGITGGADLGYNITQNIAVEGGWFYIPKVSGNGTATTVGGISQTAATTATVKSWFAYVAAKLSVPVMENFDLFGKVGVAYRYQSYSGTYTTTLTNAAGNLVGRGSYWAPVFGAGLQYCWNNWLFGAQYMYLPGNSAVNGANTSFGAPNAAPEINQYTGFLGYKFNV